MRKLLIVGERGGGEKTYEVLFLLTTAMLNHSCFKSTREISESCCSYLYSNLVKVAWPLAWCFIASYKDFDDDNTIESCESMTCRSSRLLVRQKGFWST
jgi:hypothetical protein